MFFQHGFRYFSQTRHWNLITRSLHNEFSTSAPHSKASQSTHDNECVLKFSFYNQSIRILDIGSDDIGMRVWPIAPFTLKVLEAHFSPKYWCGKRVLEIGSGTGIVGIALAKMGAEVLLTDLSHILPHTRRNILLNWPEEQAQSEQQTEHKFIRSMTLDWNLNHLPPGPPFDVIIGCDVVYCHGNMNGLRNILLETAPPSAVVYLAYDNRGDDDWIFFRDIQRSFTIKIVAEQTENLNLRPESSGNYVLYELKRKS